jgi:hypothetical protein
VTDTTRPIDVRRAARPVEEAARGSGGGRGGVDVGRAASRRHAATIEEPIVDEAAEPRALPPWADILQLEGDETRVVAGAAGILKINSRTDVPLVPLVDPSRVCGR